jgi:ankyrin repeat protein
MGMRTKNIKPKKSGGKRKTRKSNTKFRKTRSKKQKGSGATCSRLGQCNTDQNNIEDQNSKDDHLRYVIEEKNAAYVKISLDEGANPNIMITDEHVQQPEPVPAIIYAARHIEPSTTILELLVEHGASVEGVVLRPLIEASEWGNLPAVRFLLDKGANINATTGSGVTAIGYAILNEDIPMIKLMLEKRKGEIDLNYTLFGVEHVNMIDEAAIENDTDPEVIKILKKYEIEQKLPKLLERQKDRTKLAWALREKDVGNIGDRTMPYNLRHKIGENLGGGKRKSKKSRK